MAQLDLFQQFQRGKTPDAEILGFLTNYVDATLTMIKFPAEHLFSFGGGHYNAKNMVEKMNFLLKSMAGKMAKDIFNVESISQPAQAVVSHDLLLKARATCQASGPAGEGAPGCRESVI